MQSLEEVMAQLEASGTEQNRKVYRRHGAGSNLFGVSFANLEKLRKPLKSNQKLAAQLWETGNADARCLALMIADGEAMSSADLDRWVSQIGYYVHADLFARHVMSQSPIARKKADAWIRSKDDFTAQAGWDTIAILAMQDATLPEEYFEKHLNSIEGRIHKSQNRTRHAMNSALIAVGLRTPSLQRRALDAAKRIGKVVVDHGETGCKTPDAAAYILKAAARKKR